MEDELLKKKIILTFSIFLLLGFSLALVSADVPTITWEPPTPEGETTPNNWVYLNTTITDDNDTSAFFDWDNSLLGYWNFQETNSTGAYDNSSYENFGTFENGVGESDIIAGKFGQGVDFTTTEYFDTHMNYSLTGGTAFSVFAWVKDISAGNAYVMAQTDVISGYSSDWILGYSNGGLWCDGPTVDGGGTVSDGDWHLLGFTSVPGNPTYTSYLYIDGEYINSCAGPAIVQPGVNSVKVMANGAGGTGASGKVDEVMIWNRALSTEEISALYNNTANRLYHNFTDLVGKTYNYSAYIIDEDGNLNISKRNVTVEVNNAPTTPTPEINSTDGSNLDNQDLNCYDTLDDAEGSSMNVTVKWYKDDVLNLTVDYNESYPNNYEFNAILSSENTSSGDVWKCGMRLYDGTDYSSWGNSSDLIVIDQVPPIVTWEPPTPTDGDTINQNSVYLNTTITDGLDTSAFFDWNYSLRGYWSFEEGSGSTAYDNSTYSHDGTLNNMVSGNWIAGKFGTALNFPDTDDYVDLGSTNAIIPNYTQHLTLSAWVKSTGTASQYAVAFKRSASHSTLLSINLNNGDLGFLTRSFDDSNHYWIWANDKDYGDGEWHHIVVTIDGLNRTLYTDGVNRGSDLWGIQNVSGNTAYASIGAFQASSIVWEGAIDEVAVWDRAISVEEINALYDNGANRLYHNFTDLSLGTYNYSAYAIDTGGNLNVSTRSIIIAADTCTPPGSGNWGIACSDNCIWDTDFSVSDNISITGSGILTLNANISFTKAHWEIYKEDGCKIVVNSGGSIK